MKIVGEDQGNLIVKCDKCFRQFEISRNSYRKTFSGSYKFDAPIKCKCENRLSFLPPEDYKEEFKSSIKAPNLSQEDVVKCTKCGSTQISANKKGFGLGNAVMKPLVPGT